MNITKKQVKKIHALKGAMKMEEEVYRSILGQYRVESSKDLSMDQAKELIDCLEREAVEMGVWTTPTLALPRGGGGSGQTLKYEELGHREGMASPKQLRMIEGMWNDVTHAKGSERKKSALRKFLKRIVGVEDMTFLEVGDVRRVVRALEAMKHSSDHRASHEEKGGLHGEAVY